MRPAPSSRRGAGTPGTTSYDTAVQLAIGSGPGGSAAAFQRLDTSLTGAINADQAAFRAAASSGQEAFTGLEVAMIVASLLLVAGCAWGLAQRIAEYR
jgi:hypothetical protein